MNDKQILEVAAKNLTIPNLNEIRGNITLPENLENGIRVLWDIDKKE